MKKILLSGLMIPLLIGSCTLEKAPPHEGAWRLDREYQVSGDQVSTVFPGVNSGSEIKVWSGRTFVFIGRFEHDSTYTDNYGGGTYTLEGNRYEETVEYHSAPEYLGQKVQLWLEVSNDTLTQKWPVDENGAVDKNGYHMEKWVRIK